MANWQWEGLDKSGKRSTGTVQATSEREVRKILRGKGMRPKKIMPPSLLEFDIGEWMVTKGFAQPFGAKELCAFTKKLSVMINAGVPILEGLEILYKSEKNPTLKSAVKKIAGDVGEGKTISESMSRQKGFDKLYCNLVKAGEMGGVLDTILEKLTIHLEKQEKTKRQIKSALTYPVVVTFIGIAVIWGMIVFVVPQFVGMLKDTGQEPPWVTQTLIDISDFLENYSIYVLPGCIAVLFLLSAYIKTPAGKIVYDNITMRLPIFGVVVLKGNLSSFTRTMSTMLSAGVSLIDSLDICIETIDNGVIANDLKKVKKSVIEGKTLTEPLAKIKYFPDMVAQMIRVGEQTGEIDSMLEKVADVFEDEVNDQVEGMTKMIEPIIIVVLGSVIAFILVAMYLPIFMSAGGAD